MNAFEVGFCKEAMETGLTENQAVELMKTAMSYSGASEIFNHPELPAQTDAYQLKLAAAMQEQVEAEAELRSMQARLGAVR